MQIGVGDASAITPVDFSAVDPGECIGDTRPYEGEVPLVSCEEPGASPVLAVVTVGSEAPEKRPPVAVAAGYASAACEDSMEKFADEHSVPLTGLLQITLISDTEWRGPQTPVVCAIAETA